MWSSCAPNHSPKTPNTHAKQHNTHFRSLSLLSQEKTSTEKIKIPAPSSPPLSKLMPKNTTSVCLLHKKTTGIEEYWSIVEERQRERSEKAKQSKAEQRSRERGTERERDRRGSYIGNFGVTCNFVSPPHLHSLSFFSLFFFSFFEYRL